MADTTSTGQQQTDRFVQRDLIHNVTICQAVHDRVQLTFEYDGLMRVVEPFSHGWNATGIEVLRAYQVGGESRRGNDSKGRTSWRMFFVHKIIRPVKLFDAINQLRDGYNAIDPIMARIHCGVGFEEPETESHTG